MYRRLQLLIDNLYDSVIGSKDFEEIQKEIQTILFCLDKKYQEKSIAIPLTNKNEHGHDYFKRLFDLGFTNEESKLSKYHELFISESKGFLDDSWFVVKPRYELEYNPLFKQLVVVVVIDSDDKRILMLENNKTKNNRLPGKLTFIQGHVTFDKGVYKESKMETLTRNAIREIEEEIDTKFLNVCEEKWRDKLRFVGIVNDKNNFSGVEHIGVVFKLSLGNVSDENLLLLKSNEPHKHNTIFEIVENKMDLMDSWSNLILKKYYSSQWGRVKLNYKKFDYIL